MEEDEDKKTGFFSDIRKNFFLIIGGIVSLTTVIPAFLNQTSEIFGWKHISSGYCAFIVVYFIAPYIFYLLYCRIYNYAGFPELLPSKQAEKLNQNKSVKVAVEAVFIALIFFYLVIPGYFFNAWVSILLIIFPVACFSYFLYQYRDKKALHSYWKEFGMIGVLIILVFGLFFIGTFRQESETRLFPYSIKDQQNTFAAFDLRNNLMKDYLDVMNEARTTAYKYRLQANGFQPATTSTATVIELSPSPYIKNIYNSLYAIDKGEDLEIEFVATNAARLKWAVNQLLEYDKKLIAADKTNLYLVSQIDETCYGFYNYSIAIQRANLAITNVKWAKQLKVLQFKSLCWFFFLILTGLCLWFKLQVKLKELPESDKPSQAASVTDNIAQVKSLILLLFILIVPWFRQLNAKDVDLEKPFLNISLSGLANGEYRPSLQFAAEREKEIVTPAAVVVSEPVTAVKKEPGENNNPTPVGPVTPVTSVNNTNNDLVSMLNNINRNIQSLNKKIGYIQDGTGEFAKHQLGKPTDVQRVVDKLHGK